MLENLKDIILINVYWFSLPLIGYVLLRLVRDIKKVPESIKEIASSALRQHVFVVFLLSFTVTAFLCALVSIFLYIFHAPVKFLAILYLATLLLSCLYVVIIFMRNLFNKDNLDILGLRNYTLLTKTLFFVMCVALLGDFLIALYAKSNAGGDTFYHMSRVVSIINDGFNVHSSFFHNLQEGAYHYNVVYPLYAVPSKILHLEPIRVWEYSLAFYRFLQWLAIFTLGIHVFRNWLKAGNLALSLSILTVLSAMAFYSSDFFIATYPNQIVNIWLILFVINLSYYRQNISGLVLVALGFLITTTHPSYAFIVTCFMGLLILVRFIVEKDNFFKDKTNIIFYFTTMTMLMIGPIITKLSPNRLNSSQLHLDEPPLINIFGMYIKEPINIMPTDYIGWIMLVTGVFTTLFILFKLWKRKTDFSVAITLLFFFPIMAYTPITFTILHYFLPVWVIERFAAMNVLVYLFVPLGLYSVYSVTSRLFRTRLQVGGGIYRTRITLVVLVVGVLFVSIPAAIPSYTLLLKDRQLKKDGYSHIEQTSRDFKNILTNHKVIVAYKNVSYYLGAIFPISVVAVEIGHSPLAADATDRLDCQDHLMQYFNYEDLEVIKADYVVVNVNDSIVSGKQVINKPYLTLVAQNQDYYIYLFNKGEIPTLKTSPYPACIKYQTTER